MLGSLVFTYPNSWFCEVCPCCYFFSCGHIWISVTSEIGFEFLQLLTSEMCSLSSLSSVFLRIWIIVTGFRCASVIASILFRCITCKEERKVRCLNWSTMQSGVCGSMLMTLHLQDIATLWSDKIKNHVPDDFSSKSHVWNKYKRQNKERKK